MKFFAWDEAKNTKLWRDRNVGFEDIVFHIERGDVPDILKRPHPERYAGHRIFVVHHDDDVYQALISSLLHKYASGRLKDV